MTYSSKTLLKRKRKVKLLIGIAKGKKSSIRDKQRKKETGKEKSQGY